MKEVLLETATEINPKTQKILHLYYLLKAGLSLEDIKKIDYKTAMSLIFIELFKDKTDKKFKENLLRLKGV
ncbi:MAG: hypothetical protein QXL51_01015 [Candidatus Aenigmatarchaeota archaeon]